MTAPTIPHQYHQKVEAVLRAEIRAHLAFQDWALFNLLQFWVSELEPEICWNTNGDLLGIGYAGRVIVPFRWLAFANLTSRRS